jgi:hypothetical protein
MTRVDEGNGPRRSKRIKEILNTSVFQDDNHEDNNDDDNKDDSSVEYDTDDGDEPPPPKKRTSQLPMRFLPSETPRLEALSHFMQFDLSSNNVGQCDGAGCGMWHLEFLDSGNRHATTQVQEVNVLRVDMSSLLSLQSKKWLGLSQ